LTLADFLTYNYEVNEGDNVDRRGALYVRKTIEDLVRILGSKDVYDAKIKITEFIREVGLATTFFELGIKGDAHIKTILENINMERLGNNPRKVTRENVRYILKGILIK
jgi:alcohol dehydrogenase